MTPEERHEAHHRHLAEMQERINAIEAARYAQLKRLKVHAPRKGARQASRSQRVSQLAAWRSHLYGLHGVKHIGPFVSLEDLKAQHEKLHRAQG